MRKNITGRWTASAATLCRTMGLAATVLLTACGGGGGGGGGGTPAPAPTRPLNYLTISPTAPLEAALDQSVVLEFAEDLDPAVINSTNVTMQSPSGTVPVSLAYAASSRRLTVTPTVRLMVNTLYTVTVPRGIRSRDGATLGSDIITRFTTERVHWSVSISRDMVSGGWRPELQVIDVDGDGRKDVVRIVPDGRLGTHVMVQRQRSDGTLGEAVSLLPQTPGCEWSSLAVGDVNGDGKPDLVTMNRSGGGDFVCGLQVFSPDGAGGLRAGPLLREFDGPEDLQVADFNGDGRQDVVAREYNGNLGLWLQGPDGALHRQPSQARDCHKQLQVADLNGDGLADVACVAYLTNEVKVVIHHQKVGGGFEEPRYIVVPVGSLGGDWKDAAGPNGMAVGDVNGDGRADLVVTFGGNTPDARLMTYLQMPDGSLQPQPARSVYEVPASLAVGDIDGDSKPDILVAHRGWTSIGIVFHEAGGAQLEYLYLVPEGQNLDDPRAVVITDLDGDGLPDILFETGGLLVVFRQTR